MNVLIATVIGFASGSVGFLVGVLFACVVETARERRRTSWQPPREREVSL